MTGAVFASLAAVLYLVSAFRQWQTLKGKKEDNKTLVLAIAFGAIALHTANLAVQWISHQGLNLGFFSVGTVISLFITLLVSLSTLRKPLENLLIGLFPMTAIILISSVLAGSPERVTPISGGMGWHILLSILAYSVLIIAAVQAVLLYVQDMHLKKHHTRSIIRSLPPLQTMDALLFEMIWTGMILLTVAFIVGWPYVEDLRAQHLIHKTVLSLIAWGVFATLLTGRYFFGWRGVLASRWALTGTGFLILAYFGSKFVLELLLKRGL